MTSHLKFDIKEPVDYYAICKGRLQNPTVGWPAVPSGSGSLFRTIETGRNRTVPPVNRQLGFEAAPNQPLPSRYPKWKRSVNHQAFAISNFDFFSQAFWHVYQLDSLIFHANHFVVHEKTKTKRSIKQVFGIWRHVRRLVESVAQPILWWHVLLYIHLNPYWTEDCFHDHQSHFTLLNMSITIQR